MQTFEHICLRTDSCIPLYSYILRLILSLLSWFPSTIWAKYKAEDLAGCASSQIDPTEPIELQPHPLLAMAEAL